jgi:hypothetical protein
LAGRTPVCWTKDSETALRQAPSNAYFYNQASQVDISYLPG